MTRARHAQRGSMAVIAAIGLSIALACLMVVDVGYVLAVKRELQKVADLAALAGTQLPADCGTFQSRASSSAQANGHVAGSSATTAAECGQWTPAGGFVPGGAAAPSALRVTLSRDVPALFAGGTRRVQASAVARNAAYDVFSIGTGAAALNAGAVNRLLSGLLQTEVTLDAVSYQALATSTLRLADLLDATELSVGSVDELLVTEFNFGELGQAVASILQPAQPVAAAALREMAARVPSSLRVRLRDVVDLQVPAESSAAASARIQILDLLLAASQVANGANLIDLGATIPSSPLTQVSLRLQVIEPARIAIGPEGTQAHSAQVRLLLNAQLLNLSLPGGMVALSALHVPLYVEAAPGTATVERIECAPEAADCAVNLRVVSGLARACIATDAMNSPASAQGCGGPVDLMSVDVAPLGVPLARVAVTGRALANLSQPDDGGSLVRFGRGGVDDTQDSYWQQDSGAATPTATLLSGLIAGLQPQAQVTVLGVDLNGVINPAVELLLTRIRTAIAQALSSSIEPVLTGTVDPLLRVLGVRVGRADLHQIGLYCGSSELVH